MPLHGFPSDSSHKVAGKKSLEVHVPKQVLVYPRGHLHQGKAPGSSHLPKQGNIQ